MNVLCDKLRGYCDEKLPTNNLVSNLWKEYILQEESKIAKELGSLNTSQKKLLIAVATRSNEGVKQHYMSLILVVAL
ncbi:MAG: hypothetical protein ACYCQI_16730 [Gammaproteobacteria bacterium]